MKILGCPMVMTYERFGMENLERKKATKWRKAKLDRKYFHGNDVHECLLVRSPS